MSLAELNLLMLDEAVAAGARVVWASGADTAPQLEALKTRNFDFSWQ